MLYSEGEVPRFHTADVFAWHELLNTKEKWVTGVLAYSFIYYQYCEVWGCVGLLWISTARFQTEERTVTQAPPQEAWQDFRKILVASELTIGLKRISRQMAMESYGKIHLERFHGSTGGAVGQKKPVRCHDHLEVGVNVYPHLVMIRWARTQKWISVIFFKDTSP